MANKERTINMDNKIYQLMMNINNETSLEVLNRATTYFGDLFYGDGYVSPNKLEMLHLLYHINKYFELATKKEITDLVAIIKNKTPIPIHYKDDRFIINICPSTDSIDLFIKDIFDGSYLSTNAFIFSNNKEYYFSSYYYDYKDTQVVIKYSNKQ